MAENYRHIEEFRNMYPNEQYPNKDPEFYVLGSGPSLGDFSEDFFKNKISIGANTAIFGFSNLAHFLSIHKGPWREITKKKPHLLKNFRSICPYTIDPNDPARWRHEPSPPGGGGFSYIGDWGSEVMYLRYKHKMVRTKEEFAENALNILGRGNSKEPLYCLSRGTTIHMAIQAAVILGAKKVTLVGCETRGKGNVAYAQRGEMENIHGKNASPQDILKSEHSWAEHRSGTHWLALAFKPHGIDIQKYYYKDGEYYKQGYEETKENL